MSIAQAYDVAYVRFSAPDLDRMRSFLDDFGMVCVEQTAERLVMRGHGPDPVCHVTELGDPGFVALGIDVRSQAGLEALAAHDGAAIEPLDLPGGGSCVRLTDPDGFRIEAVAGQAPCNPLSVPASLAWNQAGAYPRRSAPRRVQAGASHVMRLGHCVFGVRDFPTAERWYKERFGFVTSDEVQIEPGQAAGAFIRCDRGDEPCDHHTVFLMQIPDAPNFMHAAFEVFDVDDLFAGHAHLKSSDHTHFWGVGRHILGSQVFDYWLDPWGHQVEHWTDGDQFLASDGGGVGDLDTLMGVQWGMTKPEPPHPAEG